MSGIGNIGGRPTLPAPQQPLPSSGVTPSVATTQTATPNATPLERTGSLFPAAQASRHKPLQRATGQSATAPNQEATAALVAAGYVHPGSPPEAANAGALFYFAEHPKEYEVFHRSLGAGAKAALPTPAVMNAVESHADLAGFLGSPIPQNRLAMFLALPDESRLGGNEPATRNIPAFRSDNVDEAAATLARLANNGQSAAAGTLLRALNDRSIAGTLAAKTLLTIGATDMESDDFLRALGPALSGDLEFAAGFLSEGEPAINAMQTALVDGPLFGRVTNEDRIAFAHLGAALLAQSEVALSPDKADALAKKIVNELPKIVSLRLGRGMSKERSDLLYAVHQSHPELASRLANGAYFHRNREVEGNIREVPKGEYSQVDQDAPVLHQVAAPIAEITPEVKQLVADMVESMYERGGVGIAAPQVGVSSRIFIMDGGDGPRAFINPTIVARGAPKETPSWLPDVLQGEAAEKCLSLSDGRIAIGRDTWVVLEATDVDGNKFRMRAEGFTARIIQHEVDHLDGILYIDRNERGHDHDHDDDHEDGHAHDRPGPPVS